MDEERFLEVLSNQNLGEATGRVRSIVGLRISADVPLARLGDVVSIERKGQPPLEAEIVGFTDQRATLLPLGDAAGVGPDDTLRVHQRPLTMHVSDALLGRVLDGLGRPVDAGPAIEGHAQELPGRPLPALSRPKSGAALPLGIRAIDGLCTLAEGQRVGLFAGPGLGKSTLLQQIAQHTAADVVVLCLVGERGREVADFVAALPLATRARSVIVQATSDAPPLLRLKSAQSALTAAEHFADQGKRVLLLMDSLTRFARAARDVGLSAGEVPVRRGYPASVFALLPRLIERAGMRPGGGSITALYSVLVEGDGVEDPIADELRGLLDGHITLRADLAARGHYPAVDVLHSLSRLMPRVVNETQHRQAAELRSLLAVHEESRDLLTMGAVKPGMNPQLDRALQRMPQIEAFLRQPLATHAELGDTLARLATLLA